ncbi:indolepyruvate ferredoxin oxidoreductase subunit alpha [Vulcanisaeta thermophila]|uniref:indolepyruvate ferredoxin oxidoreductase subunit alpha n=1 Tax=Vulcanisaeta thermophila TaxID=867917 RepID=UPI000853A3BE|nr:4Fe-4S binding protein [Vulcanisaeta thermophila]
MVGVREDLDRIVSILRSNFDNLLISGSTVMRKLFNESLLPEEVIEEAEGISSTFRRVSVLTDDVGFMNSLGSITTMRVRGGVVVVVYDMHDIRPLCSVLNIPCLEPWDSESLLNAIIEGRDYSEAFEVPYVVRVGPWLTNISMNVSGKALPRPPTFNKNWGEPMRWGLGRFLRVGFELPMELTNRAKSLVTNVGFGDRVLVSGSAWSLIADRINELSAKYELIRSLYMNPLPTINNIKHVIDVGSYLTRLLGVDRLMGEDLDKRINELISKVVNELFFRGPGDPVMLIEWFIYKSRANGEVPVSIEDMHYSTLVNAEGMGISYEVMPTFHEVSSYDQVMDIVGNALPIALGVKVSGYDHGRIYVIANPCSLTRIGRFRDLLDGGVVVITLVRDNECPRLLDELGRLGVKHRVLNYDPSQPTSILSALPQYLGSGGLVIIKVPSGGKYRFAVIDDYCDNCGDCLRIRCPAITMKGHPSIDPGLCVGCGICELVCERGAITRVGV